MKFDRNPQSKTTNSPKNLVQLSNLLDRCPWVPSRLISHKSTQTMPRTARHPHKLQKGLPSGLTFNPQSRRYRLRIRRIDSEGRKCAFYRSFPVTMRDKALKELRRIIDETTPVKLKPPTESKLFIRVLEEAPNRDDSKSPGPVKHEELTSSEEPTSSEPLVATDQQESLATQQSFEEFMETIDLTDDTKPIFNFKTFFDNGFEDFGA